MKKTPTAKQTRHHYKNVRKKFHQLLKALNESHDAGVIDYKQKKNDQGYFVDTLESVCDLVWQARDRHETATKDQLAAAMKSELMSELKGVW